MHVWMMESNLKDSKHRCVMLNSKVQLAVPHMINNLTCNTKSHERERERKKN